MRNRNPAVPQSESMCADAPEASWAALIPDDQWVTFRSGIDALDRAGVNVLLGGALALASYTGHWRNTKDVDVIVHEGDQQRACDALLAAGFEDYFPQEAYDRSWIFRSFKEGVIFDVIWNLPNHRVQIEEFWFQHGHCLKLKGISFLAVPAEELVRMKLYVMQRNRCDWVDVLNVLASTVSVLDWNWLVQRMGRDLPLLHSVLALFNWMCAGRAREIPEWVRTRFALPAIQAEDVAAMEERRTRLLDSRPWFALHQPADRPLEL